MNHQKTPRNVIVVGASAGGVEALIQFFGELPADLAAAVLVVLHIPSSTPSQLAPILARATRLPVKPGVDLEEILPGQVYVASADRHLMVDGNQFRITRGPRESRSRPSIGGHLLGDQREAERAGLCRDVLSPAAGAVGALERCFSHVWQREQRRRCCQAL